MNGTTLFLFIAFGTCFLCLCVSGIIIFVFYKWQAGRAAKIQKEMLSDYETYL